MAGSLFPGRSPSWEACPTGVPCGAGFNLDLPLVPLQWTLAGLTLVSSVGFSSFCHRGGMPPLPIPQSW